MEIPAIGTFMISMRTKAMQKVFKENKEVVFFSNYKECLRKCLFYISNTRLRNKISRNAHFKVTKILKVSNEELINQIIYQSFK